MNINRDILLGLRLQVEEAKPSAKKPQAGDVWRAKDGRLIVVRGTQTLRGKRRTLAYCDGSFVRVASFTLFLLSLQAEPVGRVQPDKIIKAA